VEAGRLRIGDADSTTIIQKVTARLPLAEPWSVAHSSRCPKTASEGAQVPPEADLPIAGIGKRPTVVSDVAQTPLSLMCETLQLRGCSILKPGCEETKGVAVAVCRLRDNGTGVSYLKMRNCQPQSRQEPPTNHRPGHQPVTLAHDRRHDDRQSVTKDTARLDPHDQEPGQFSSAGHRPTASFEDVRRFPLRGDRKKRLNHFSGAVDYLPRTPLTQPAGRLAAQNARKLYGEGTLKMGPVMKLKWKPGRLAQRLDLNGAPSSQKSRDKSGT
jgi:hypothetical protein